MSSYNDTPSSGSIAALVLGLVFLVTVSVIGVRACTSAEKATFGAVDQEIDRRNFERSQSYREGLRRDFDELMLQYAKARSDDERTVVLSTLRHRVAGAPPEAVPDDVKKFIASHTK